MIKKYFYSMPAPHPDNKYVTALLQNDTALLDELYSNYSGKGDDAKSAFRRNRSTAALALCQTSPYANWRWPHRHNGVDRGVTKRTQP